MKILRWKKGAAIATGLILAFQLPAAGLNPVKNTYAYTEKSASVNASSLNVRSGPGTANSIVTKLTRGTSVTVVGEATASDGALWYQIRFTSGGQTMTGYASKSYIKFKTAYSTDGDFEAFLNAEGFPESYKDGLRSLHAEYPQWVFRAHKTGLDWNTVIENESVVGRNLVSKNSISSWKSIQDGAYNWSTGTWPGFDGSAWVAASSEIISYYMDPRNFLDEQYIFQFLLQSYDSSVHTTDGLLTMLKGTFMESGSISSEGSSGVSSGSGSSGSDGVSADGPGGSSVTTAPSGGNSGSGSPVVSPGGNSDSDAPSGNGNPGIKFEGPPTASISAKRTERLMEGPGDSISGQSPGESSSASPGSTSGGNGSVSSSNAPSSNVSYGEAIMKAGEQSGVNPYVLAAMIIQEVGSQGSRSVSGKDSSYPGYYNFYNIGAYTTDTMDAVTRGLWYAAQSGSYGRPWNTPEKAIAGGALFYGDNYVKAGQDTFYLKKFNVQGSDIYKHQYMGNVVAAASEGYHMSEAYNEALKKTALEFKIPVYNNMPSSPCAKPTIDGSPNNKLSGLGVEGFILTPTFSMNTSSYDLIVDQSVTNVNVWASAIDSKASVSGIGNIDLQSGINEIRINVKAENGTVREYVLHVVRQQNGPTYQQGTGGSSSSVTSSSGTGSSDSGSTSAPDSGGISSGGPGEAMSGAGSSGQAGEVKSPLE